MIYAVFKDLASMLRNRLVFLILFIGLAAGSFAMCVYYAYSSQFLRTMDVAFNQHNSVQFYPNAADEQEKQAVLDLLSSGKLPEYTMASVVSFDKEDFDVVGFLYAGQMETGLKGEYCTDAYAGQYVATVSGDLYDDPFGLVGTELKLSGKPYEIIGVMGTGEYVPDLFDIRRLPRGQALVAGIAPDEGQELQRSDKAVYIPMDVFAQESFLPAVYRITFAAELGETERTAVQNAITEATGLDYFAEMTKYSEIHATNRWGKAVIYFAAIFASLFNVVALFGFILKKNRKQYVTYRLCGATTLQLSVIILLELTLYTAVAFIAGFFGCRALLENTSIIERYLPFGAGDFVLLFALFLCVAAAMSFKQIRSVAGKPVKQAGR